MRKTYHHHEIPQFENNMNLNLKKPVLEGDNHNDIVVWMFYATIMFLGYVFTYIVYFIFTSYSEVSNNRPPPPVVRFWKNILHLNYTLYTINLLMLTYFLSWY